MNKRYKYGETVKLYALLDHAASGGLTLRLAPESSAAILREFEYLCVENRELANMLKQALVEANDGD